MRNTKFLPLLAVLVTGITACGGSGGDAPPAPMTVTGAAVKGIVRNADVLIVQFPVNALTPTTQIGRGTTDANGDYNVTLGASPGDVPYAGGAIQITVSSRADGSTRVVCDVNIAGLNDCGTGVGFGDEYNPGTGFVMTSRQSGLGSGINTVHTTPLTTLIANRSAANLSGGRSSATAVRAAMLEVNQLAGNIDVVRTRPANLVDPAAVTRATPQQVALAALGAAAQRRTAGAGVGNLQTAITAFVNTFSPPVTAGTPTAVPVADYQALIAQTDNVVTELGLATNVGTALDSADDLIALAQQTGGSVVTTVDPSVSLDAVSNAKAFIADIRTIVNEYGAAFDNNDLTPFGNEIEAVVDVLDTPLANVTEITLQRVFDDLDTLYTARGTTGATVFQCQGGNKTVTTTITYGTSVTTIRILGESCTDQVDLTGSFPSAFNVEPPTAQGLQVTSVTGTVETKGSSGVRLQVSNGTLAITSVGTCAAESCYADNLDKIVLDFVATITAKGQQQATSFTGAMGFTAVRCNTQACVNAQQTQGNARGLVSRYLLAGAFTRGTRTSALSVSFGLDEASARLIDPELLGNQIDAGTTVNLAALLVNLTVTFDLNVPSSNTPAIPATKVILSLSPVGTQVVEGETKLLGTAVVTLQRDLSPFLVITSTANAQNPDFNQVTFTRPLAPLNPSLMLRNLGSDSPVIGNLFSGLSQVGTVEETSNGLVLIRYSDGSFESFN